MIISLHLRDGENQTNMRAEAIAEGLQKAGCKVITRSRTERPHRGAQAVLQTGFAKTAALTEAINEGIPYLLAEAGFYRLGYDVMEHSSYNWCGLAGGAEWLPEYPNRPNRGGGICPELRERRWNGMTLIAAQVPNDHSLRGSDHSAWLREKIAQYPNAIFRPHPKMATEPLCTALEAFDKASRVITYSSTFGAEALIQGVSSTPEHYGSIAYRVNDRERWAQELTWKHGTHEWLASEEAGRLILDHYESAKWLAQDGMQELPRNKVKACHEYILRT